MDWKSVVAAAVRDWASNLAFLVFVVAVLCV